jgi:hypothetical protein
VYVKILAVGTPFREPTLILRDEPHARVSKNTHYPPHTHTHTHIRTRNHMKMLTVGTPPLTHTHTYAHAII